jgi:hypothetical protein
MSLLCLLPLHLQAYEQQEQQAQQQLAEQQQQFEAAVADILGIPAGQQQAGQLAEAVQEQQQLQEAEVRSLGLHEVLLGSAASARNEPEERVEAWTNSTAGQSLVSTGNHCVMRNCLLLDRIVTHLPSNVGFGSCAAQQVGWHQQWHKLAPAHLLRTCRCSSWLWNSSLHSLPLLLLTAASTKPKRLD